MLLLYASYDGAINKLKKHTLSELKNGLFLLIWLRSGGPFFSQLSRLPKSRWYFRGGKSDLKDDAFLRGRLWLCWATG